MGNVLLFDASSTRDQFEIFFARKKAQELGAGCLSPLAHLGFAALDGVNLQSPHAGLRGHIAR